MNIRLDVVATTRRLSFAEEHSPQFGGVIQTWGVTPLFTYKTLPCSIFGDTLLAHHQKIIGDALGATQNVSDGLGKWRLSSSEPPCWVR